MTDSRGRESILANASACDIADALLKLEPGDKGRPLAGFLEGIDPRNKLGRGHRFFGPAFTVLFKSKQNEADPDPNEPAANIAKGVQWSDLVQKHSVVVVKQPSEQRCAAVGGHHASRMEYLEVGGLVVSGRVRDRAEMDKLNMPVWSRGTSIVGAGAEAKAHAVQVPLDICGVVVNPGDYIFCDPDEGAVRIPKGMIDEVLNFLQKHEISEQNVKKMIREGHSVQKAFEKCR